MIKTLENIKPVFVYDFETVFEKGGNKYLKDFSSNSLDALFPGGINNPTESPSDASFSFDGNDSLTLPGNFYSVAPTGSYSFIAIYQTTAGGNTQALFSSYVLNTGLYYGINANAIPNSISEQIRLGQYKAGATNPYASFTWSNLSNLGKKTRFIGTIESTPKGIGRDSFETTTLWTGGTFGTVTYDTTYAPVIGTDVDGNWFVGKLFYLALLPESIDLSSMIYLNKLLQKGFKPWCHRWL